MRPGIVIGGGAARLIFSPELESEDCAEALFETTRFLAGVSLVFFLVGMRFLHSIPESRFR